MTRKDYIVIAEALRVQLHRHRQTDAEIGVEDAASEIADSLQRDNSRFNREHFLAVVRGEKELLSRPSRGAQ